ncbi:hydroxyethylthiazole kinase [Sporomusa sp.]|uniref:hydroxyethylthiazole kinase n=1 Tax=Sporomusa sp. TaxID=2078658 RepID=UPI002CC1DD02|nr:hydroxyethylthiazole kinase [Sporomusa sp.]HWR45880.1 hydroxyethylthiazole kinase [Sporomusa sp.]
MDILYNVADSLRLLREKRPLIHHITNYVSINDCANITLGIGASPVMAEDIDEVQEMVSFASALVLNIGMLNPRKLEAMIVAGQQAVQKGIPIIFDPVGVGATKLRMDAAHRILTELQVTVIRGNLSEIKALLGLSSDMHGVDCLAEADNGREIAQKLSERLGCVVAITGRTDVVAYGSRVCSIYNGHALLAGITGTGCMTASLIACFCSVTNDPFIGTVASIATMGIAGELAEKRLTPNEGLGTFRVRLLDAISTMNPENLLQLIKLS